MSKCGKLFFFRSNYMLNFIHEYILLGLGKNECIGKSRFFCCCVNELKNLSYDECENYKLQGEIGTKIALVIWPGGIRMNKHRIRRYQNTKRL